MKKNSFNKVHLNLPVRLNKVSAFVFCFILFKASSINAQIELKGINTAPNLASSFNDASLPRDSRFNEPLDLLNDFYPSIEVRVENHSNVRRRPGAQESDNKLIVEPNLAYRANLGRHGFYAAYSGRFDYHSDFTSEDSSSHQVNAKLGLDISSRWDVDLFGTVGNSREERGVSGTRDFFLTVGEDLVEDDGRDRDRISFERYGIDVIYGRKLDKLKAVLGYERSGSRFSSSIGDEIDAGDRDRNTESVHFDIEYRLASRTSVFGRVEYTSNDFDRSLGSLDSDQFDWLIGLRIKPTNRLSGVIGYGRSEREFDDNSLNDYDGNNYYANLTYSIKPYSTLQFGASRSIEEPISSDASLFISEVFSVSWEHALTDNLVFDSYAKFLDDDFDNGREDEFFDWGVSLDYSIKPWLTLGLYYQEIDRDSNVEGIAFDDDIIGMRLRSDLRPFLKSSRKKRSIEPSSFKTSQKSNIRNVK